MIDDIIETVEDYKLRCNLGLASTGKSLLLRMANNPTMQDLAQRIQQQPDEALECLKRAQELYALPIDPGHLHPDDIVVTAYLFLIAHHANPEIRQFIQRVAQEHKEAFRFTAFVSQYFADHISDTIQNTDPIQPNLPQERPRESIGV